MLSKPSVPQAQLYGRVSLCLTLFFPSLPFSSAFCSPTDPLSATVIHIFLCNFPDLLLTPDHICALRDSGKSLQQSRQHIVNTDIVTNC